MPYISAKTAVQTQPHCGQPSCRNTFLVDGVALELTPAAEASAFEAFVGALHMEKGSAQARQYTRDFIIHTLEKGDLSQFIKFEHPKATLKSVLETLGEPALTTKLVKESGRLSHLPTFVIGAFSGERLLAQAASYSLATAEHEAVQQALYDHFTEAVANAPLPSDADNYVPEEEINVMVAAEEQSPSETEKTDN
eukprot:m.64827 g.64827  ORF g.64827 m.64827 type:complete len:195 (-) comp14010_c0_seq17:1099-1683(-)